MEHDPQRLRDTLYRRCQLLEQDTFFSFKSDERQQLIAEGKALLNRIDNIELGFLSVGLIGGTGVGKSTLMNALAGKEIATTSDRRPHTDHILVYKHEGVDPRFLTALDGIPSKAIAHDSDDIRGIILCDLPDFDSIVGEHRRRVIQFLEHLDVLVWVASIEKYADGRFYEFLEVVPKAEQNFYFVLNKADQFFQGNPAPVGYESLERVVINFRDNLKKSGVSKPLLYALSAKEAIEKVDLQPWNQFQHFSRHIFQQKDIKSISAIKAANLDVEVRRFSSSFQIEARNLKIFKAVLDTFIEEIQGMKSAWLESGKHTIAFWTGKHIKPLCLKRQTDLSCLKGPGYGIALIFETWSQRFDIAASNGLETEIPLSEDVAVTFEKRLEWLRERLKRQRLFQDLPDTFETKIIQTVDPAKVFSDFKHRLQALVTLHLSKPTMPFHRWFRIIQRLAYGLVFLLFMLAVGGEAAWRQMADSPGWHAVYQLLISMVYTLFSGRGLAALGSLLLLNLLLGFRFYYRFRKHRNQAAEKMLGILNISAANAWGESLEEIVDALNRLKTDIHNRIELFSDL